MVVFELFLNNEDAQKRNFQENEATHILIKKNKAVPKSLLNRTFSYFWDDGHSIHIEVKKMSPVDAIYKKLLKLNTGFECYEWMVDSLIRNGRIVYRGTEVEDNLYQKR